MGSGIGKAEEILANQKNKKPCTKKVQGSKLLKIIIQKAFCRFQQHYPNSAFPEYDNRSQHAKPRR